MIVEKTALNEIRGVLRRKVATEKKRINSAENNFNYINNALISSSGITYLKEINRINDTFKTKFDSLTSIKKIINYFEKMLEKERKYCLNIESLMSSFDKDGINVVTYSFPIFCSLSCSNEQIQKYLTIIGIKYNGENAKNEDKMDELEKQLHSYEIMMARLIQDDFTINQEDIDSFKKIYIEYIKYFYEYNKDIIDINETDINEIINKMSEYLIKNKDIVNSIKKQKEEQEEQERRKREKKLDVKLPNPILEKQVIEKPLLDEKEKLKQQILELSERKNKKLEEVSTPEELELYNQAKISGNIEATKTIKDIDAAIELLLEETNEKEIKNLNEEIKICFNYLRNLLIKKEEIETNEDLYEFYYSTNNFEDPTKCWFMKDIKDVREESLNSILKNLKELKKGFSSKIKKLDGTIGCFEIKDDQVRIVFRPIEENKIVILGAFIKKADNDHEMFQKLSNRSIELSSLEYSMQVEEYFEEYVNENARKGTRK